ncbi:MAG: hypothetical protein J6R81_02375 [Alistipes sp.]|nr:hypothetical protein [Alistipes sp.]
MKNLFKNLVLVAVAAMAFTACEKDKNVSEPKAEGTTYTIEVSMDDTRSMFGEMNGDAYSSQWEGDEELIVYLTNHDEYYFDSASAAITVYEDNLSKGYITFTLPDNYDGSAAPNNGKFYAYSPKGSITVYNYGNYEVKWDVLKEQTPRENNVDAKAHVVVAEYDGTIYSGMNLEFKHAVAYAKMSFKDLPTGVTAIDSVVVEMDNAIYTLTTSYTENIWFAVQPDTPATASITIVSGDKSYKKDLAVNDKFAFETGVITGFTVDMSAAEEVESGVVDTFNPDVLYTNIAWNSSSSRFELTGGNCYGKTDLYINAVDAPNNNSINVGTYPLDSASMQSPASGKFGLRYLDGTGAASTYQVRAATLDVTFDNGEYTLLITVTDAGAGAIIGKTYGYKGMPEGWVAPAEGSQGGDDSGEQEETIDLTGFTKCNLTSLTKGQTKFVADITITDVESGDTYTFSLADLVGIDVSSKTIKPGVYTFVESFNSCEMEASGFKYCDRAYNATGSVTVYNQDGTYTIKCVADLNGVVFRVYYQGTL